MAEETYNHRVMITNREQAVVEGVVHVEKFDEDEIVVETDLGMMAIRGENLHIKEISVDQGRMVVDGAVRSIDYLDDRLRAGKGKGRGWLERIFS